MTNCTLEVEHAKRLGKDP
ncbi:Protein of unknown function [Bacillus mycoides]|nr:Protein of unknown function [Bacillus mycoides]